MTNLEKMIGELKMSGHDTHQCCRSVYEFKNHKECSLVKPCDRCEFDSTIKILEYLNEEYNENIEMSAIEYELLVLATKTPAYKENDKMSNYGFLRILLDNEYFDCNIDTNLTIKEILNRVVIVYDK